VAQLLDFPTLPQATASASLITVPGWRTPPGPTSPTIGRASRKVKLLHPHTQYSWRRDPPLRYLMRKPFADPGGSLNRRRMHKRKISFLYFQFRALFTLFSKFFSYSFTVLVCYWSLTEYLALPEIYPAFRASLPRSTTLWKGSIPLQTRRETQGCHLLWLRFPAKITPAHVCRTTAAP
jgi:hypothetical protein